MGLETSQSLTHQQIDNGPVLQVYLNPAQLGLTTELPSAGNLIPAGGYKSMAVCAQSTSAGILTVQRYIDTEGAIPQGPQLTLDMVAGENMTLNINDNAPFQSFIVIITGPVGTLSDCGVLLNAN
jgi:hypothetical protein